MGQGANNLSTASTVIAIASKVWMTLNVLLSYFILNDKNIDGFGGITIIFVAIVLGRSSLICKWVLGISYRSHSFSALGYIK